jgi:hypothetical protein
MSFNVYHEQKTEMAVFLDDYYYYHYYYYQQ